MQGDWETSAQPQAGHACGARLVDVVLGGRGGRGARGRSSAVRAVWPFELVGMRDGHGAVCEGVSVYGAVGATRERAGRALDMGPEIG